MTAPATRPGASGSPPGGERPAAAATVEARAELSKGISADPIYEMVVRALRKHRVSDAVLADVGCGTGNLRRHIAPFTRRYIGVDVVRYEQLPAEVEWVRCDLDTGRAALADGAADVVAAVETIEHLENPRAFVRELVRIVRPGGLVIVTTPNQESALSLGCLIVKGKWEAFQEVHYPAHLTALLAIDLRRIAAECGLENAEIGYSLHSRVPLTAINYPRALARLAPRRLSDNMMLVAKKPEQGARA